VLSSAQIQLVQLCFSISVSRQVGRLQVQDQALSSAQIQLVQSYFNISLLEQVVGRLDPVQVKQSISSILPLLFVVRHLFVSVFL
jgi:hypothetical protein